MTEIARSKPFDVPFGRLIGCLQDVNCSWRLRFGFVIVLVGNGGVALTDYFTMRDYVGSRVQRELDVDDDQAHQQTQPLVFPQMSKDLLRTFFLPALVPFTKF